MKKFLVILMVILVSSILVACGGKTMTPTTTTPPTTTVTTTTMPTTTMPITTTPKVTAAPSTTTTAPRAEDYTPIKPTRLFDNLYYVGTNAVGSIVIDSGDGLIMIDTGWNDYDCALFVNDMKTLGLDPSKIKLILISHDHGDHYGGVTYLKREVCPNAKVALNLTGWLLLQARPVNETISGPKPKSIDMFLTDGQVITQGNTKIQVVYTPGHAPGCVSFIIPVTDNGVPHAVGIMGGSGCPKTEQEAYLYYSSIGYFMEFTKKAKCDVGLGVHAKGSVPDFDKLRLRKAGEPNPLVIGTEKFESVYLQGFRDAFNTTLPQIAPRR